MLAVLNVLALAAMAWSCTDGARAPAPRTASGAPDTSAISGDSSQAPLAVILVPEGDVLNARSAPGVDNAVVAELPPHTSALIPTGETAIAGGERWLEVRLPGERSGWVHSRFTTEQVDHAWFCDDARIGTLLGALGAAMQARDGAALAALVSPRHSLTLRRHWWNPEVRYDGSDVASIFTADAPRDWGTADGTGFPITGSFSDVALPLFDRLYAGKVTWHCNDIENGTGSSAGYRVWPFEYANVNYYALYRAAAPGEELDWNTWAVGIEYADGAPYIAYLVHYQWEI